MGKIIERCAGIDVGKRFLFCCILTGAANEEPHSQTIRFDATVPALERAKGRPFESARAYHFFNSLAAADFSSPTQCELGRSDVSTRVEHSFPRVVRVLPPGQPHAIRLSEPGHGAVPDSEGRLHRRVLNAPPRPAHEQMNI